jgi:hypothetical protein
MAFYYRDGRYFSAINTDVLGVMEGEIVKLVDCVVDLTQTSGTV